MKIGIDNTVENFLKIYKDESIKNLEIMRVKLISRKNRQNEIKNVSLSLLAIILAIYTLIYNIIKSDTDRSSIIIVSLVAAFIIFILDLRIIWVNYITDLEIGAIEIILKEKQNSSDTKMEIVE